MTIIQEIIRSKENAKFVFKPDKDFYQQIDINQKRWGQLCRGDISPTIEEGIRIAKYFDVSPVVFFDSKLNS